MSLLESILAAFRSVCGNKTRSLLTMLGVIIGISAVIIIMSLGNGIQMTLMSLFDGFNIDIIQVYPTAINAYEDQINENDLKSIEKMDNVNEVIPFYNGRTSKIQLKTTNETVSGYIAGVNHKYPLFQKLDILYGRFISENDVQNQSEVAVITSKKAEEIFGYIDCVGKKMTVQSPFGNQTYTVIGVFKVPEGGLQLVQTPVETALFTTPITTIQSIEGNTGIIDFVMILPEDSTRATDTALRISNYLNLAHEKKDNYYAGFFGDELGQITGILSIVTYFVAFVAFISLFVGGVGVMNIMLVSVTERTREIGIRKSLGATDGSILTLFVLESIMITFMGGFIGIVFGLLISTGIASVLTMTLKTTIYSQVSPVVLVVAVGISVLTGILSGAYPALRAAKLDPVDSLRYE